MNQFNLFWKIRGKIVFTFWNSTLHRIPKIKLYQSDIISVLHNLLTMDVNCKLSIITRVFGIIVYKSFNSINRFIQLVELLDESQVHGNDWKREKISNDMIGSFKNWYSSSFWLRFAEQFAHEHIVKEQQSPNFMSPIPKCTALSTFRTRNK